MAHTYYVLEALLYLALLIVYFVSTFYGLTSLYFPFGTRGEVCDFWLRRSLEFFSLFSGIAGCTDWVIVSALYSFSPFTQFSNKKCFAVKVPSLIQVWNVKLSPCSVSLFLHAFTLSINSFHLQIWHPLALWVCEIWTIFRYLVEFIKSWK